MDPGSPEPRLERIGDSLLVAYRRAMQESDRSPQNTVQDLYAVLQFSGVAAYRCGAPSDETLHDSLLYREGIRWYDFFVTQVDVAPTEWVIAFHDETLQVTARSASVLSNAVAAMSSKDALELMIAQYGLTAARD
jgi:hypothetical protein